MSAMGGRGGVCWAARRAGAAAAAHRDALVHRALELLEVALDITDAVVVAARDLRRLLVERDAVLGDDDPAGGRVAAVDPLRELVQPEGGDVPAEHVLARAGGVVPLDVLVLVERAVGERLVLRAARDHHRGVVLEGEEVGGVGEHRALLGREGGEARAQLRAHRRRVVAKVDRVGEPAEVELHRPLRRRHVGGGGGERLAPVGVEGDRDDPLLRRRVLLAVDGDGVGVGEQQVVARNVRLGGGPHHAAGRVVAEGEAVDDVGVRLVDRDPVLHAVAEALEADARVRDEGVRRVVRQPAVVLELQRQRQVPVVQRRHRVDAVLEELVDQRRVEGDALVVHRAGAAWHDPRPRDREAVVLERHLRHQLHVGAEAVEVVRRDVAGLARLDLAGRVRERVPDRQPAPPLHPPALDLVRRGRRAPRERGREGDRLRVGGGGGHGGPRNS